MWVFEASFEEPSLQGVCQLFVCAEDVINWKTHK